MTVVLDSQVTYVRSFAQLISVHLRDSVRHANLVEEFEAEMIAENRDEEERYYQELEDMQRESAGLTPLGEFVNQLEDSIPESQFATDVIEQFERLNKSYGTLEELSVFYEDELDVDDLECSELVRRLSHIVGCGSEPTVENLKAILDWIENKKIRCEMINTHLPDYITIGEDIEFLDVRRNSYIFSIDGLEYLVPDDGGSDIIDIRIRNASGRSIAKGTIDITYGFIEEDPLDGVGDGCEEDIEYNTDEIVGKMKEIADEWENYITEEEKTVEGIKTALE